jgi:hypothetical protein
VKRAAAEAKDALEANQLDQTEANVPEENLLKVRRAAVEAKDALEENLLEQTEARVVKEEFILSQDPNVNKKASKSAMTAVSQQSQS